MTDLPLRSDATPAGDPARSNAQSDLVAAARVFAAVLVVLLGVMLASAVLFADLDPFWGEGRPERLARFCAFVALLTAYSAAALVVARRGARRDFAALRGITETSSEQWQMWEVRFRDRRGPWVAAAAGALFGLAVDRLGAAFAPFEQSEPWGVLVFWAVTLNAALFATLAVLVRWSLLEIGALRAIGRRVLVSLLDRTPLAPFVRTGLRGAALWLVGTSLATTLLLDVNAPWLVLAVMTVTMGLAVAFLLLPSLGLHERLHAVKAAELAWVRGEIARAREALAACAVPARDEASRLPALLAWEGRVEQASVWPFDAPSLARFAFFLLVPLLSWLGGALVERAVDALIGS
jgi:hypothetical protein